MGRKDARNQQPKGGEGVLFYRLRRWLFQKLSPRNMVVLFDGAEYTTLCDADTMQVWGVVNLEWIKGTFTFTVCETGRPADWGHSQLLDADCCQNSEK